MKINKKVSSSIQYLIYIKKKKKKMEVQRVYSIFYFLEYILYFIF